MRVLVTRPRQEAEEFAQALQKVGAQVFFLPTIEIQPIDDFKSLDRTLSHLSAYSWLVFTSANAVIIVAGRLEALGIAGLPEKLKIAAVGPKTAARLIARGVRPDFVPEEYVAEAIVPGLGDLKGQLVLLPTADIAPDTLPKAIQAADGIAHVITAYKTKAASPTMEELAILREGVDLITFASGSSAQNFVVLTHQAGMDPFNLPGQPLIACIGPKTAQVAKEAGFRVDIVADWYTMDGLVQAIASYFERKNNHDAS
jgi:uroporphyrinogen III methyltransferase / synthase